MIKRAVTEMTPIEENAPIIYTPRKEGVKAEYNVRTDRMDIALEAATAYNEHYYGQRKEYYKEPEKYNYAFANTALDSQNFMLQFGIGCIARRKMSAKLIPNL